jgi:hypothetical protein
VRASLANISPQPIHFALESLPSEEALVLVSGPLEFVRGWNSVSLNPTLVLCDAHIRARNLCCSGTLRWTRLRHETFGGVTHYQALLGTNIPDFEPSRTTLRRTIRHAVDYGIKPAWSPLPTAVTLKSTLSLNQRLHPECLTTPILYHSAFSSTGWGSRCLSSDVEIVSRPGHVYLLL